MGRTVLHVDLDAFFASVEQATRPELRGLPVVVGGIEGRRGVVTAASYEARRFGVRAAMPVATARRLCPAAIFVQARYDLYVETSRRVMEMLDRWSPVVEQASLDEAYIDYTGCEPLLGLPAAGAESLRRELRLGMGLAASVGIAGCRLVAKVASAAAKPDGVLQVQPGDEAAFLAPLPLSAIPGLGPASVNRLSGLGCRTVADLQRLEAQVLVRQLGQSAGAWLDKARFGLDDSPVQPDRAAKSLGHESTFEHDVTDERRLLAELRVLTERAGLRLRHLDLQASTVTVKYRYQDFDTPSRSRTLPDPVHLDIELYRAAADLFRQNWDGRPLRLLGVSFSGLSPRGTQAGLFEDHAATSLQEGLDQLRERYGRRAVFTADAAEAGADRSASAGAGRRHDGPGGETPEPEPAPDPSWVDEEPS